MKKFVLFFILSAVTSGLMAQDQAVSTNDLRKQRWEEMKAKRAAYYTEVIGLTAEEAQLFWPVFNELQEKKGILHRQMFAPFKNAKKDAHGKRIIDFAKANDGLINMKLQEAKLDKIYHERFKKILCPEKLFKFYDAERDWANKLLKDIEKRGDKK
jgi:hypothetical protein